MNSAKYTLIGAASILSLSVLAPSAFAAFDEEKTTEATVTFTAEGGGTADLLTLDYGPVIDFSSQALSLEEKTYNSSSISPSLQVTDRRGGGGLGWNIMAKASAFSKDETVQLKGAVINFATGTASQIGNTTFTAPEPESFVLATDGVADSVVVAAENTGLGTWLIDWNAAAEENDKITLTVPAGAASEGTFISTLTWTLSDTPTN